MTVSIWIKKKCYCTFLTTFLVGYRTIAVNQLIDDSNIEPKKKKKKGEIREPQDVVPLPYDLRKIQEIALKLGYEHFKVLNRLTIAFAGQEVLHKIVRICWFYWYTKLKKKQLFINWLRNV